MISPKILLLKIDDWRVRQHFKHVEDVLRTRDVSHLPAILQKAREQHIARLHNYAARGVFPRNYEHRGYAPCFIDRNDRECAVAHLMIGSGHAEAAHKIASISNYAYVPQMTFPELDDWAKDSGLSSEELALIQPGYYLTVDGAFLSLLLAAWTTGFIALLLNVVQMVRRRSGGIMPGIGLVFAIPSLLVSIYCLYEASYAYELSKNPDFYAPNLALQAVDPLVLAALISLGIALLCGGLSFYRIRTFIKSIPKEQ